ncbi:MAG: Mth938-like domain-containing protein [Candidatus Eisenbacteria bacterium]
MIDSYEFGEIVIDGKTYTSDVIIYPDRIDDGWRRKEGHKLSVEDIKGVLDSRPEVLVVGTGYSACLKVESGTKRALEESGVELIVADTTKACREFNQLAGRKSVVAALHLTC